MGFKMKYVLKEFENFDRKFPTYKGIFSTYREAYLEMKKRYQQYRTHTPLWLEGTLDCLDDISCNGGKCGRDFAYLDFAHSKITISWEITKDRRYKKS